MCIDHEKEDFAKVEKLIKQKIDVIDDKSYLEQAISKSRILGYKNFDENGKEKYKDINSCVLSNTKGCTGAGLRYL